MIKNKIYHTFISSRRGHVKWSALRPWHMGSVGAAGIAAEDAGGCRQAGLAPEKAGHAFDRVMRRPCGSGQAMGSSVGTEASAVRHGGPVAVPGGNGPAAARRLAAADPDRPWSRPATEPRSGAIPHPPSGTLGAGRCSGQSPRLVPVPTRSTASTPCRRRSGRPTSSGFCATAIRSAAVPRYNDRGHDQPRPHPADALLPQGGSRPPDCRRVPSLLQPRAQAHDPQRDRAMRISLQDPGVRADRSHPRPDPPDAGLNR